MLTNIPELGSVRNDHQDQDQAVSFGLFFCSACVFSALRLRLHDTLILGIYLLVPPVVASVFHLCCYRQVALLSTSGGVCGGRDGVHDDGGGVCPRTPRRPLQSPKQPPQQPVPDQDGAPLQKQSLCTASGYPPPQ